MEEKIEKILQRIYKKLNVQVVFEDIRKYGIIIKIDYHEFEYETKMIYTYDVTQNLYNNINCICDLIDNQILIPFFKEGE